MLHPLATALEAPRRFTYPFRYEPHPLCQLHATEIWFRHPVTGEPMHLVAPAPF